MPRAKSASSRPGSRCVSYFLRCLVLISFFCLDCRRAAEPPPGSKYNLLLISIDTLRADHLKCYGYKQDTSPHLDRLAKEGVLFENLTSASSWTVPSHMSMFTSLYPSAHGVQTIRDHLGESVPTLARCLAQNGYLTQAFVIAPALDHSFGFNQGFQFYDDFSAKAKGSWIIHPDQGPIAWNRTSPVITDLATEWLKKHSQETFFLFLHYFDCHSPYIPPAPYDKKFDPDYEGAESGRRIAERSKQANLMARISVRDLAHMEALYDGGIAYTDEHVGKILQLLQDLRLSEKTLVIVLSDHGEAFLEHGLIYHGNSLYEEELHAPLIMRLPGAFPAGKRVAGNVSHVDLMPTVLGLLHLACPSQSQGIDLSPAILGDQPVPERLIYSELKEFGYDLRAVRWDHRKLLGTPGTLAEAQLEEVIGDREKVVTGADLKKACPETALQALTTGPPSIPGAKAGKASEPDPELLRQLKSLGYTQ
jgi:arylsulfatase A-like enzyme